MSIEQLRDATTGLIDDAIQQVQTSTTGSSTLSRRTTAQYMLIEGREYAAGAWELLAQGRCRASLSLSRWALEAAIALFWVVADEQQTEERLTQLGGEALRHESWRCDGLAELFPKDKSTLKAMAANAGKLHKELDVGKPPSVESLVKQSGMPTELYALYRACSSAAHPGLQLWRRFGSTDDAIVAIEPQSTDGVEVFIAAASIYYLVISASCLAGVGDSKELKAWWSQHISPLLP